MIYLAPSRDHTLELVERVSRAGRGGVSVQVLLDRICRAVAEAFDFSSVAAMRYDADAEEVSEAAFSGAPTADRADHQAIADHSLLVEARDRRSLVLLTAGDLTFAFALPLISGDRCLGFLFGTGGTAEETDEHGLATVGIVAATLLENALAREELAHRDVLKSEFLALAVHELRNPLASIYGISVTLNERGDELSESRRAILRKVLREQAARMRSLVEQLLDLSRLDLEDTRVSPEPVRLRPKIEELARTVADARPNALTIAVPVDLQAVVDPVALDRMLSNLIANALRHGEPPVTVTAVQKDSHLRLVVEDRGEGVPSEFVPRLFDRFVRGPASRGSGDGSGLGLTIAQAYARAHGGKIVYEPAVPHGARFEVVLPLRGYGDAQRPIDARARARRNQTLMS
jgi:signal transduction histidine kinase